MAEAVIGALRVNLGIDSAQFATGLATAQKKLGVFSAATSAFGTAFGAHITSANVALGALGGLVGRVGVGMAAGLGVGVAAVGGLGLALQGINRADELGKLAQRIGIPVEQLSLLAHTAEINEVQVESLGRAVVNLSTKLVDAGTKGGEAARVFNDLGINVKNTDGSLKNAEVILGEVADKFAMMEDGVVKTNAAADLFGKKIGTQLIPMLNQGGDALRRTNEEARRFGLQVSAQFAKDADEYNDNVFRMTQLMEGLKIQLAAVAVGPLKDFTEGLITMIGQLRQANANIQGWWALLTEIASGRGIKSGLAEMNAAMDEILDPARPDEALAAWIAANDKLAKARAATAIVGPTDEEKAAADEALQRQVDAQIAALEALDQTARGYEEAARGPYQIYADKLAEIAMLQEQAGLSARVAAAMQVQAGATLANTYLGAAGAISGALAGIFKENKGVAIANAIINTAEAVTAALKNPPGPPFSFAYAAAALASGVAQIATIRATNPGSTVKPPPPVKGASTAATSAGVSSGATGSASAARGPNISINLHGEVFSREAVRGLAEQFRELQKDGGVITIT